MKKKISIVIALLLTLSLIFSLASCELIEQFTNNPNDNIQGENPNDNFGNDITDNPSDGSGDNETDDNININPGDNNQSGDVTHGHNYEVKTVAPTCNEDGYVANYCIKCGDEQIVEVLYAFAHNIENIDDITEVNPTCESEGYRCNVCSICDAHLILETIPALGHMYEDCYCTVCGKPEFDVSHEHEYETITFAATCIEDGCVVNYCAKCGDEEILETISALGHIKGDTIKVDPTCEDDGYEYIPCANCGEMISIIPLLNSGHDFVNGICSICGKAEPEVPHKHEFETVEIFPTCYEDGYLAMICATCGYEEIIETIPILAHFIISESVAPSCDAYGSEREYCEYCGLVITESIIPPLGHEWSFGECINCGTPADPENCEHLYENTIVDASCLENGFINSICIYCADCKEEIIYAEGHKYDQDGNCPVCGFSLIGHVCTDTRTTEENRIEATTCDGKGSYVEVVSCIECGKVTKDTVITDSKIPHTPKDSVIENEIKATCTSKGSYDEVVYCAVCNGEISRETINVPSLSHIPKDIVIENATATCIDIGNYDEVVYCSLCNIELSRKTITNEALLHNYVDGACYVCGKSYTSDNLLFEKRNNTYTVNGIGECTDTIVIIPEEYKGLPVTVIGSDAFKNSKDINHIIIPKSVISISYDAFSGCANLVSIIIDDNNEHYSSIEGNIYSKDGKTLTIYAIREQNASFTIPNNVTTIGDWAFYNCSNLTSVIIGNKVTSIGYGAFHGCTSLASITIPNSVTSIGERAFLGCSSLTSISIPDSVASIENYTFGWCSNLTTVDIGDSVTSIGNGAFQSCESLMSITLGNSVTNINENAFSYCYKLVEIINHSSLKTYTSFSNYQIIPDGKINSYAIEEHTGESKIVNYNDYLFYTYDNTNCLFGYVGKDTELILPEKYNGENYLIYRYAFFYCDNITKVIIPDSVTEIGIYAFSGCDNLVDITIGNNVTKICGNAFSKCNSLTDIIIPDSVTSLGGCAFLECGKLTNVTIGKSVTHIYQETFSRCYQLKSVNLPYGVTTIGYGAFRFTGLSNIDIPDSVTSIGQYAFYSTPLENITIPDSVTRIEQQAFEECSKLTNVIIGNGITNIEFATFRYCNSLTSVTISNSVTSISNYAFYKCSNLLDVYYTGTTEEWSSLAVGSGNDPLTSATVYFYSEIGPTGSGNYWHYDEDGNVVVW